MVLVYSDMEAAVDKTGSFQAASVGEQRSSGSNWIRHIELDMRVAEQTDSLPAWVKSLMVLCLSLLGFGPHHLSISLPGSWEPGDR